jgi:archaellum component FlaC
MMSETVARPIEPQPMISAPETSPSLEERRLEEAVPKDIFVKLDSFGDVLTEMTIMRSSLLNLKSLALIQSEVQDLSNDINNLVKAYSDEFESSLSNLETIIEGVSDATRKAKEVKFKAAKPLKAKAVEDLESRIKKLRTEIEGVKKK